MTGLDEQNNKWQQTYSDDTGTRKGTISGIWKGDDYKAKWYVKGDNWCERGNDWKKCWQIVWQGPKKLKMYMKGKPEKNLWTIK